VGRNLLKAPLLVLLAQARDTRIHLIAMVPVREAFAEAELDLGALEEELAAATVAGSAAFVAGERACGRARTDSASRRALCRRFRDLVLALRTRLDREATSDDPERARAALAVRAWVPTYPGRTFARTARVLPVLVDALVRSAAELDPGAWRPDLLARAEALLAEVDVEVARIEPSVDDRSRCTRGTDRAKRRLRAILQRIRVDWTLAVRDDPTLPRMPLGALEDWANRGEGK
jgi:hypothetical protein